jgi:hypothetical protein
MPTLLLRFAITLEDYSLSEIDQHHGPLFHRWLPDGEKDCIVLDTDDPSAELKIWFQRWGFVEHGFIVFSYERREVDPEIIPKQAVLDAGPLMGLLRIEGLSEEQLASIRENKVGDDAYVALGKRVVKRLVYPPVNRFINVLRTNYGQYWIRPLEEWDSRRESLGGYCSFLQLKWSPDGQIWEDFLPDEAVTKITARLQRHFPGYLTEEGWQELREVAREGYEPSLGAVILSRTHQLLDQGNMRHAVIEGVIALEVALSELIRRKLGAAESLIERMSAFWNLPLPSQLVSIAAPLGTVSSQDIEDTVRAIEMRNKVIHQGWNPPDDAAVALSGLLRTVAALLSGPRFRFPSGHFGNSLMSAEEWEQQAE